MATYFTAITAASETWLFLVIETLLARMVTARHCGDYLTVPRDYERFGSCRAGQFAIVPLCFDLNLYAGW